MRIEDEPRSNHQNKLQAFLEANEPFLELPSYSINLGELSRKLRSIRIERQEELLREFLGPNGENFPNANSLVSFLIKTRYKNWLRPNLRIPHKIKEAVERQFSALAIKPPELEISQATYDEIWEQTMAYKRYLIRTDDDYESEAVAKMRATAEKADREYYFEAAGIIGFSFIGADAKDSLERTNWGRAEERLARDLAREYLTDDDQAQYAKTLNWWKPAEHIAEFAKLAARWTIVEDQMREQGFESDNPFEALFDGIYNKGYYYLGIMRGKAIVLIPAETT